MAIIIGSVEKKTWMMKLCTALKMGHLNSLIKRLTRWVNAKLGEMLFAAWIYTDKIYHLEVSFDFLFSLVHLSLWLFPLFCSTSCAESINLCYYFWYASRALLFKKKQTGKKAVANTKIYIYSLVSLSLLGNEWKSIAGFCVHARGVL